ncbi:hypothetical protein [Bdellovibrio sp. HCB337]|uniref:hypothetical protein n=1 Tax=Bdellovibrio sp. HCB337 TaxID=3394358 RepID=UPI0039A4EBAA
MLLALILFFNPAFALTPEQVLKTAWTDKTYLAHEDIQETDSKNPFRSVEAFYSHERNGNSETEVGLKFNMKSYPEWRSGSSQTDTHQILKESSLAWALRDRYNVLLGYVLGGQKLKLLNNFIEAAEKNLQAQTLALRAVKTSTKAFLEAKDEFLRLKRSQSLLLAERQVLKKRLDRWSLEPESTEIEDLDLIEVDDVAKSLKEHEKVTQTLSGKLAKEEIWQLDQELKIVKGRENQWFKSFDVSQTAKKDEHVVEVGLTIFLPPLGSDDWAKQKQNELILKIALKQRDLENTSDRLQVLRFQILNSIELYKLARTNQVVAAKSKSLDPLVNMQTKITSEKEKLELLNQRQSILNQYLEYLVESEVLSKEPGINHLSRSKKAIL